MKDHRGFLDRLRTDRAALAKELGGDGQRNALRCPFHDDHDPSGSIFQGADGFWRFRCHSKCNWTGDIVDVVARRDGVTAAEAIARLTRGAHSSNDKAKTEAPLGPIVATYDYRDERGELLFQSTRHEPKDFRQRRPDGKGGWIWNMNGVRRVLYRLPELLATPTDSWVFVSEGEKDVDNLRAKGAVATCNPQGAGKWSHVDDSPLRGRRVVILPDNDERGQEHADDVARSLHGKAAEVRILALPGLPRKGDVSDWLDAGHTLDELTTLVEQTPAWQPTSTKPVAKPSPSGVSLALSVEKLRSVKRWVPFPVTALPAPIGRFVTEASAALGCDEAMVALPVLAVLASAIGTTRRIQLKRSWREPCVAWSIIIARSGQLKSPALDKALEPIVERQRLAFREHKRRMAEYRDAMCEYKRAQKARKQCDDEATEHEKPEQPIVARYVVEDCTVEALCARLEEQDNPRGLLLARDELSGLFAFDAYKSGKGNDVAHYLKMHGARDICVDRKTGDRTTLFIQRAAVSIAGGVQPKILARALGQQHFENGFAARCLMAMPPSKPKHWSERAVSQNVDGAYHRIVNDLFALDHAFDSHGERVPVDVPLSPDARAAWAGFYNEHGETQVNAESDDEAAAFAKLEGYAARFALIFHCVRCVSGDPSCDERHVDAESVGSGIELARWFVQETSRTYGELAETDENRDVRQLLELIRRKGGRITARELQQRCRRFRRSAELAEEALQQLVDAGLGEWENPAPGDAGGRPSRVFVLAAPVPVNTDSDYETPRHNPENDGFVDVDTVDATEASETFDPKEYSDWGEV